MSTRWHIDETKRHVERLYGRAQVSLASPSLRSVVDRQEYAQIHYHDTLDVLDAFVKAKLRNTTLLEIVFASDDVGLTRFSGHFIVTKRGVRDGKQATEVYAGVPATDGRAGPGRA